MKILHLSKFYPPDKGGLEHIVARLAEGAGAAKHEVRVVSAMGFSRLREPGRRRTEPPLSNVVVVRVPTLGIVWSQPIAPAYLDAARWPADIVHVHHPHPLADIAVLRSVRAPFVITHHSDVRRQSLLRPFYWPLVRSVLKRAAAVIVPTQSHIGISAELRGMEHKIRIVPFGVDESHFKPNAAPDRPAAMRGPGPYGLFVGRLVGYKGLDILVDAVAGTDLQVVIVGEGPLRRGLEWEVVQRGLTRQIRVVGEVPAEELASYYQSADYVILPSTSPAEMFGISLLEAMACAKPIITTSLPTGVREVNAPGVTGLEVPPGDAEALRAAMHQMAGDAELRKTMGAAGRKRVEERFTLKRMVDEHLALYQEILGR